jgi:hypothetical protein
VARRLLVAAALVDVSAFEPIQSRVSGVTPARVRAGRVHADRRVRVAMMTVLTADAQAFIDVCGGNCTILVKHDFVNTFVTVIDKLTTIHEHLSTAKKVFSGKTFL